MKRTSLCLLAAPLMLYGMAAGAAETPVVYQYGMQLDIDHVISIEQPNDRCEVSPAQMTYVDSKGQVHVLEYLRQTEMCSDV
ncbi:hypothetical protein D3C76_630250 [compost metagenome]|uniref:DUF2790 domain-containing protein n=1 Tax=Pseudomonas jinjuensis TaxID=198616 RepID=A0A1G9Z4A9_9PSED|nr:DUF2790 domain-containing protein [Pseudomonas jinjuensis]SDN16182.1 Protein of unknown function [Pseudomonas jinjuensis]